MKTYCIINIEDVTMEVFDESVEQCNTFRKSLDGTKAILTFLTPHPTSMRGVKKYNLAELRSKLADDDNPELFWRDTSY